MPELTRRQAMRLGAVGVLAGAGWTATARTGSAAPAEVRAAGDLALWYDEAAGSDWLRALPVGNGRLGAMVFGNTDTERVQLNEDTVWAGGPHDYDNPRGAGAIAQIRQLVFANQWGQAQSLIDQTMLGSPAAQLPYQPVGDLRLTLPSTGGVSGYERWLDLTTATSVVTYVANGVRHRREVFASAPDQVIVMRLTADTEGAVSFSAAFSSPQRTSTSSQDGTTIALDGVSGDARGIAGSVRFLALARVVAEGGSVTSSGGTLRVSGATAVTLLVSVGTSYVDYRTVNGDYQAIARSRLTAAQSSPHDTLRARHVSDHRALFDRVTIDLGRTSAADQPTDVRIAQHGSVSDPQFAALLFQYGRYLLIASSRPGSQPANLQGIWNDQMSPPWDSKYTINANLPLFFLPAVTTILAVCVDPVFWMVMELSVSVGLSARVL